MGKDVRKDSMKIVEDNGKPFRTEGPLGANLGRCERSLPFLRSPKCENIDVYVWVMNLDGNLC